jgi:hypothetical protein
MDLTGSFEAGGSGSFEKLAYVRFPSGDEGVDG